MKEMVIRLTKISLIFIHKFTITLSLYFVKEIDWNKPHQDIIVLGHHYRSSLPREDNYPSYIYSPHLSWKLVGVSNREEKCQNCPVEETKMGSEDCQGGARGWGCQKVHLGFADYIVNSHPKQVLGFDV